MPNTPSVDNLPKQYDHAAAQDRWYTFWQERGYFHSEPDRGRKPYTIVIPPPNVTGALHLGHALNNTLQDIVIRQKRMQGFATLWLPGTDHAGIATQAVVERRLLEEENTTRHDIGRQGLVRRIWQWKESYERRILDQLKQMGCSCDWQRTRFTLDSVCARAVRHTFFSLFKERLIYRGKRLVNWDTMLRTAVSDDEVFHETVSGHFWYFHYPVIDPQPGEPAQVTIATTRPETMLGDTAVAVHGDPAGALDKVEAELNARLRAAPAREKPDIQTQIDDVRRRRKTMLRELLILRDMALDGRRVMLPLVNREIPLVADEWAKPELGTGCVKITPAHDANDYEVGLRQNLPMVNILNPDGTLSAAAGPYQGQTVMEAREHVVADLKKLGLLGEIEDREIDLAHSDRSKTPIEPFLTDQWFVKMDRLSQIAMDAVSDGRVKIIPQRYAKGYHDWLGEKRDWPISRQLWWGHQIPIWTFETNNVPGRPREVLAKFDEFFAAANITSEVCVQQGTRDEWYVCAGSERAEKALDALEEVCDRRVYDTRKLPGQPYSRGNGVQKIYKFPEAVPVAHEINMLVSYIAREPDVLDTWFSSALWPHSTLGWPEQTEDLKYFYPTSTLITSRDIITLWVARMVLAGLHNVGEVPFREVYIHPKILDGYGEGMSKSKGNGVDPLDVMDKFGADSLRFGLAYLTTETQDIRMPVDFECPHCGNLIGQTKTNRVLPRVKCKDCGGEFCTQWAEKPQDTALPKGAVVSDRFELARNFCNKLWNASRFALLNLEGYTPGKVADEELLVEDRWILSRLCTITCQVTDYLDEYKYADAARTLYDFAWDEFCSFFVEMVKSRLQDESARPAAQRVLAHTLDALVRLLHPMIPFVTEEVWQLLGKVAPERGLADPQPAAESIMIAPWPEADAARRDPQIEAQFAVFQNKLRIIRDTRSRNNLAPKTRVAVSNTCETTMVELMEPMKPYFESMANATIVAMGPDVEPPPLCATVPVAPGDELHVHLGDAIDIQAELQKKEKENEKLDSLIAAKKKKLDNKDFLERAPRAVVQKERDSLGELVKVHSANAAIIEQLAGLQRKDTPGRLM